MKRLFTFFSLLIAATIVASAQSAGGLTVPEDWTATKGSGTTINLQYVGSMRVKNVKVIFTSKTYSVNNVSFKMVNVEGGTFMMGAQNSDKGGLNYAPADPDESPVHEVTLSTYSIGETEVTQALWKAVMGADNNPSNFNNDSYPVEQVSWNDVQEFIAKLNELTGETFRLPTEAEWEYAARGGRKSKGYRYAGSNNKDAVAWYNDNSSRTTHTVGSKAPNELGLYDMSGNVYEWCSDWYGDYGSESQTNPTGAPSGSAHVYRGGGWLFSDWGCRVSDRTGGFSQNFGYSFLGFRLAH